MPEELTLEEYHQRYGSSKPKLRTEAEREPVDAPDYPGELIGQVVALGLPVPEREALLIPGRKSAVDLLWRPERVVVEVEGGYAAGGSHVRPGRFRSDARKYNALTLLGYRVFRIVPEWIESGEALTLIEQALAEHTAAETLVTPRRASRAVDGPEGQEG